MPFEYDTAEVEDCLEHLRDYTRSDFTARPDKILAYGIIAIINQIHGLSVEIYHNPGK